MPFELEILGLFWQCRSHRPSSTVTCWQMRFPCCSCTYEHSANVLENFADSPPIFSTTVLLLKDHRAATSATLNVEVDGDDDDDGDGEEEKKKKKMIMMMKMMTEFRRPR